MPSGWDSLVSRNSGSREHSCWDELGLIVPVRSPCAPRGDMQGDSCSGTRWLVFTAGTDRCELEWVLQFPSLKIGWTVSTRALPLSFSLSLKMDELASSGAVATNSEWCLFAALLLALRSAPASRKHTFHCTREDWFISHLLQEETTRYKKNLQL